VKPPDVTLMNVTYGGNSFTDDEHAPDTPSARNDAYKVLNDVAPVTTLNVLPEFSDTAYDNDGYNDDAFTLQPESVYNCKVHTNALTLNEEYCTVKPVEDTDENVTVGGNVVTLEHTLDKPSTDTITE